MRGWWCDDDILCLWFPDIMAWFVKKDYYGSSLKVVFMIVLCMDWVKSFSIFGRK
jgi:hypothetical protein